MFAKHLFLWQHSLKEVLLLLGGRVGASPLSYRGLQYHIFRSELNAIALVTQLYQRLMSTIRTRYIKPQDAFQMQYDNISLGDC